MAEVVATLDASVRAPCTVPSPASACTRQPAAEPPATTIWPLRVRGAPGRVTSRTSSLPSPGPIVTLARYGGRKLAGDGRPGPSGAVDGVKVTV